MKKLFLIAAVFGSLFFTSCDPEPISDEFQNPQACCGEDGTILPPPPPPPPTGSGNNGG